MRPASLIPLAIFDLAIFAWAIVPSAGVAEPASTFLHIFVAGLNAALLARVFGAAFPAVYLVLMACGAVETIQIFVPDRSASFDDMLAAIAGIAIGLAISSAIAPTFDRRGASAGAMR